jgi:hypothetical protein
MLHQYQVRIFRAFKVTNYNSSGGKYVGGILGYVDGATGGYATNNASGTNYNSANSGGYGSIGSYTAGNSDGNAGGYNSPIAFGAVGSGSLGEFGGGLNRGSTGLNNGNNFARNVTGGSYSHSIRSGGFSGGKTMCLGCVSCVAVAVILVCFFTGCP